MVAGFCTVVYGSKTLFSLPFCKYCSKVQTVSETKFSFGLNNIVIEGDTFLIRSATSKGGWGNHSAPTIDVNAFRTTNFWSRSAMRSVKFHGNSRCDSTTHILSIG